MPRIKISNKMMNQSGVGSPSMMKVPTKQDQYTEYKLRVPKNLVKKYNVMKLNTPRPVKFDDIKEASMVRKTKKQVYIEDDTSTMPIHGAGSVYNFERKEEARKKRRGYVSKKISRESLPYALRLGGKGGKRYTGRKEPMEHSAYYILTQCPDGVFEAVPVQAWYNFTPDIDYVTLNSEEVEHEFSKRDRTLNHFATKYTLGVQAPDQEFKVKQTDEDHGLMIHDDILDDENDEIGFEDDSDDDNNSKKKKPTKKSKKNLFQGKKKKQGEDGEDVNDSDQEETIENMESKEVDYMSESSSEDELNALDDEPDPEKDVHSKAKDELNVFSDSSDDEEEETNLNEAGKELKAILKKEGQESSDEEDEDIDNEYSKSAVFNQGKDGRKKKRSGSNSGSKPGSRSSTPTIQSNDQASETLTQAAKSLKDGKLGKRTHERSSPSPQSKKQKLGSINVGGSSKRSESPLAGTPKRSGTPSDGQSITEEAIRKYLSHKPMTTTDLVRKFKTKKTGLTKEQTVNAIAAILKRLQLNQEKVDGKLYLSIKSKK